MLHLVSIQRVGKWASDTVGKWISRCGSNGNKWAYRAMCVCVCVRVPLVCVCRITLHKQATKLVHVNICDTYSQEHTKLVIILFFILRTTSDIDRERNSAAAACDALENKHSQMSQWYFHYLFSVSLRARALWYRYTPDADPEKCCCTFSAWEARSGCVATEWAAELECLNCVVAAEATHIRDYEPIVEWDPQP